MEFEWIDNKNRLNFEKQGVSFDRIKAVFDDPNKVDISVESSIEKYGKQRNMVIGAVKNIIYVLVYTLRRTVIRIISARNASKAERKIYNDFSK